MRSLIAAVLVAGSLAGPALRAMCELSCVPGAEQSAVAAPSCHESVEEPAAVRLDSPEDCGDHDQQPAVAAGQRERAGFAQPDVHFAAQSVVASPSGARSRAVPTHALGSASPPIPPGTRILRV